MARDILDDFRDTRYDIDTLNKFMVEEKGPYEFVFLQVS